MCNNCTPLSDSWACLLGEPGVLLSLISLLGVAASWEGLDLAKIIVPSGSWYRPTICVSVEFICVMRIKNKHVMIPYYVENMYFAL